MGNQYPHIPWRRLEQTDQRRLRQNLSPPRPPLRSSAQEHGGALGNRFESALTNAYQLRLQLGIDPSSLLVLSFTFLEGVERESLERLGIHVVSEEEIKETIQTPYYCLEVVFETEALLNAFISDELNLIEGGVRRVERIRGSNGLPSSTYLSLCFTELVTAKACVQNTAFHERYSFRVRSTNPKRISQRTLLRVVVQFRNGNNLQAFQQELEAYRSNVRGSLTANQRHALYDSIDDFTFITPEDRTGNRLRTEGTPQDTFYLDVDLWHPGQANLLPQVIQEFTELVTRNGGRVTDSPMPVAETLLLSKVLATSQTLEALLRYDRVVRVDLPLELPAFSFSPFAPITPPDALPELPANGPLACLIDSGVVPGHPLLSGLVRDERDFDSGENTPADMVGHGTSVAGVIAYGDVARCVQSNQWIPRVNLLSAKVMRAEVALDGSVRAGFSNESRVETQIRNVIDTYTREFNCRVFNISFGNQTRLFDERHQLHWALLLDELAVNFNVVIVVSAGNAFPQVPQAASQDDFQRAVREQLYTREHSIIDPASAANVLTVGSLARNDVPYIAHVAGQPEQFRPPLVGSPRECPSPFTRCGQIETNGAGLRRLVKPELVAFGGNFSLDATNRNWSQIPNPHLGEVTLNHNFQGNRLVKAVSGTSFAAPFATHVCALAEAQLRNLGYEPTANLIKALAVHSAVVPEATQNWLRVDGNTDGQNSLRILRVAGYGIPNSESALFSTDNRAVLVAQDLIGENLFHVYELELPEEFVANRGTRRIKATLVYDPPVRGTRKDYISRTMWLQMFRGLTSDAVFAAMRRAQERGNEISLPARNKLAIQPSSSALTWSTVQSTMFEATRQSAVDYRAEDGSRLLHIYVRCHLRFPTSAPTTQRYALVLSLEHSDAQVRIYQTIRQRERVRQRQGG